MNDQDKFRRLAAISTLLAALALVATHLVHILAIGFDFAVAADLASMIALGDQTAEGFRWGAMLDAFGYYLLLVPAALYLWRWLRPHSPNLVDLLTAVGLGGLFIGASEAVIRLSAMTGMMHAYVSAAGPAREMLVVVFKVLIDVVFFGLATLAPFLFSVWVLGLGLVLRHERRMFGLDTVGLGLLELALFVGALFQIDPVVVVVQGLTLLLAPVWVFGLGIVIWRNRGAAEQTPGRAPAVEHFTST
jgi:hypothetical protein